MDSLYQNSLQKVLSAHIARGILHLYQHANSFLPTG
jgi:hypothetical protein